MTSPESQVPQPTRDELCEQVAERLASWGISYVPQRSDDPIYDQLAERVVSDLVAPVLEAKDAENETLRAERFEADALLGRLTRRVLEALRLPVTALRVDEIAAEVEKMRAERDDLREQVAGLSSRYTAVPPQDAERLVATMLETYWADVRAGRREDAGDEAEAEQAAEVMRLVRSWFAPGSESVPAEPQEVGDLIDERDSAEEWADKLAYAIAPVEVIGEHSNANNPWANALEFLESQPALELDPSLIPEHLHVSDVQRVFRAAGLRLVLNAETPAAEVDPSRASATSEASRLQANSKLEQDLEMGRPSASTPPASGSSDTGPRVWTFGEGFEPRDCDRVRDSEGDEWVWRDAQWHCVNDTAWPPLYFQRLLADFGPLTEVVSSTEQEKPDEC
ncbi:hypothetical protein C8D88_11674 [Lentzea atacamensis]|uniref:Uncharacterized protein n=1 Tax=Lentzea atacamensis TaxID=531938 RepID=A0A316HM84_9PSEU|nr:hypothetical protein [Lentzea atacamensis]PWK81663.1 hypothetical protein C8D88_11674 [Lentzea atacamensis]